jgi:hypothetical protein
MPAPTLAELTDLSNASCASSRSQNWKFRLGILDGLSVVYSKNLAEFYPQQHDVLSRFRAIGLGIELRQGLGSVVWVIAANLE